MEITPAKWLPELEMVGCSYDQYEMNNYPHDYTLDELNFPANEKVNSLTSTQLISFGDYSAEIENKFDYGSCVNWVGVDKLDKDLSFLRSNQNGNLIGFEEEGREIKKAAPATMMGRNDSGNGKEHVMAERRRREKLSQNFLALSALIPGLNKRDKASVLGGAIKYVKELQERVKWAEEEAADQKRVIKSVVFAKRIDLDDSDSDEETSSWDKNDGRFLVRPIPKIEARVLEKDVLVRIHCKKHKGCFTNIICQIEKLKLTIVNSCVLPFGHSRLDITIVAKMEAGFCMTARNLGKKLRETLVEFI